MQVSTVLRLLEPGTYSVKVNAPGFKESLTTGVRVELGEARGFDVHLSSWRDTSSCDRDGQRSDAQYSRTRARTIRRLCRGREIAVLHRSAGALLALTPGVRYTGEDPISYGASRYNMAGWTNVNVIVDGTPANGDREDVAQMVLNPTVWKHFRMSV